MMQAALALVALLHQESAEDLFRKFEKKFVEAKSVSCRFRAEISETRQKDTSTLPPALGRVVVKPGDKYRIELTDDAKSHTMEARSDGVTAQTGSEPGDTKPAKKGASDLLTRAFARTGWAVMVLLPRSKDDPNSKEDAAPKADECIKVSDFKLGAKGQDGRLLVYKVSFEGVGELEVMLLLDDEKLVPLKRVCRYRDLSKAGVALVIITETYEEVSTDEVPDSEFEIKKE